MKNIKKLFLTGTLLATMPLMQGCFVLAVGAVAAGAAYGTVKYVDNSLEVTEQVPLETAWSAANGALKEMSLRISSTSKDDTSGVLKSKNAQGQPVTIKLTWKAERVTLIHITVGTFDSPDNRAHAEQIYNRMKPRM
jgi:hypothetical protein